MLRAPKPDQILHPGSSNIRQRMENSFSYSLLFGILLEVDIERIGIKSSGCVELARTAKTHGHSSYVALFLRPKKVEIPLAHRRFEQPNVARCSDIEDNVCSMVEMNLLYDFRGQFSTNENTYFISLLVHPLLIKRRFFGGLVCEFASQ